MAEYEKKVREILKQNGYSFHHRGRGDHDVWFNETLNIKVTVDGKIKSRHMANQIIDLFGNPVGSLTSPAFFRAKALQKCCFYKEVVQKLKFPNNSNERGKNILSFLINFILMRIA